MMHNTGITAETAEVAALAVDGPQPGWMTLNAARERAFTGEIVFETDPEVFAYLDNGIVYYAERASDASLGRRLLGAGVVDVAQLECGTVRVGDIEHLGRLFDRDPSVDRDAVIVTVELMTEELITELANRSIVTVRSTAYRHHPSGVHRWFVAPLGPNAITSPASAVAPLDTTVLDELPALSFDDADVDDLVIEWEDEIADVPSRHTDVFELSPTFVEYSDYIEFTHADAFSDADAATPVTHEVEPVDDVGVSDVGEAARADYEFSVVWPNGSEEPGTGATAYAEESIASLDEPSDVEISDAFVAEVEAVLGSDDGSLRITMPPLELSDETDSADAVVPDDVAEAVRRAIAAIDSASVAAPEAESGPASAGLLGEIAHVEVLADTPVAATADPAPAVRAPAGLGGFAPPTMATHAEVLYAQMQANVSTADAAPDLDATEAHSDSGNDRTSALRRLIGSLRRKDH